jgi:hypothetical protein
MISSAPVNAAEQWPDLEKRIRVFIAAAQEAAAGGVTWPEFGELLIAFLRLAIYAADTVVGMPGAKKKELVVAGVAALFDTVADKAIPTYFYPVWLLTRSSVRALVLAIASGAIEVLLPMVRAGQ